jgi:hypothetical protein
VGLWARRVCGARVEDAVGGVDAVEILGNFAAEKALRDGLRGIAFDFDGAALLVDRDQDGAGVGAVVGADGVDDAERGCYQESYTTSEQMGTLTFNDVDVRLLPNGCGRTEIALVTGKFHLQRTAHGEAKKDDGIFSLVWRKGPHGLEDRAGPHKLKIRRSGDSNRTPFVSLPGRRAEAG